MTMFLAVGLYFLPTIVAACRGHRRTTGLFLVNLFLGWTLLAWFVVLWWAFSGKNRR